MATTKRNLKKSSISAGTPIAALPPGMKRVALFGHSYRTLAAVNTFTIAAAQHAQARATEQIFHRMFPGVEYSADAYMAWMEEHPLEFAMVSQAMLYDVVFTPDADAPPMSEVIAGITPEATTDDILRDMATVEEHVGFFTRSADGRMPKRDESATSSDESGATPEGE